MRQDRVVLPVKNSCVVELRGKLSSHSSDITNSCSGIIVDATKGLVITTASVFHPFLEVKHHDVFKRTLSLDHRWFRRVHVNVTVEADYRNQHNDTLKRYVDSPLVDGDSIDRRIEQHGGEILQMCKVPSFATQLSRLFSSSDGWKITDNNMTNAKQNSTEFPHDYSLQIHSSFVLIKLRNWRERKQNLAMSIYLDVGDTLYAVATPFGVMSLAVFMNSVSKGVISNVAESLFVTDARSVPGCEGGALYTGTYPHSLLVVGMIVVPLCWKTNEWIGLAIGCGLSPILQAFQEGGKMQNELKCEINKTRTNAASSRTYSDASCLSFSPSPRVVLVKSGPSWGSGILMCSDPALVLTCSHVIRTARIVTVRVDGDVGQSWYRADVIYRNEREQPVFDVAVISLRGYTNKHLQEIEIATCCNEGDDVIMVGHPVFDSVHKMKTSVTEGIVSNVITVGRTPVMIQSSCAVNGGASGGAVLSTTGALVGLVCCNAKETTTGATYPHINFSIPVSLLWPAVKDYIQSRESSVFKSFEIENKAVKRLWTLEGQTETFHNGPAHVVTSRL